MTYKERLKIKCPENTEDELDGIASCCCPNEVFGEDAYYEDCGENADCDFCWNREIPEDMINELEDTV